MTKFYRILTVRFLKLQFNIPIILMHQYKFSKQILTIIMYQLKAEQAAKVIFLDTVGI